MRFFQDEVEVIGRVSIRNDGNLHIACLMAKEQVVTLRYLGSNFPETYVTLSES